MSCCSQEPRLYLAKDHSVKLATPEVDLICDKILCRKVGRYNLATFLYTLRPRPSSGLAENSVRIVRRSPAVTAPSGRGALDEACSPGGRIPVPPAYCDGLRVSRRVHIRHSLLPNGKRQTREEALAEVDLVRRRQVVGRG